MWPGFPIMCDQNAALTGGQCQYLFVLNGEMQAKGGRGLKINGRVKPSDRAHNALIQIVVGLKPDFHDPVTSVVCNNSSSLRLSPG